MKTRARFLVIGLVQGVGYRSFAYMGASKLDLTGYVRNLPNGNVESVVEGEKELINEYHELLKKGPFYSRVTHVDVTWSSYAREFSRFEVRF